MNLFNYQLGLFRQSVCLPILCGTRIPCLFVIRSLFNYQFAFSARVRVFHFQELFPHCYFSFRVYLIIKWLSSERQRAFLLYVELESHVYLDFEVNLILNLLPSVRQRAFLFYVEIESK